MISCHEMMVSWHEMTFLMYGGPTLYKIGLAISVPVLPISANVCILCRKRLQPLPQTFASFASNVCKYLQPSPQSIASFPASVCLFWHKRYPSPDFVHPIPTCRYAPLLCSYDSKIFLLCIRIFLWPWPFLQDAPFLPIIYNARFVKKM